MIEILAQIVVPLAALAIIAAHEKHEAELRVVEPVPSFAGSPKRFRRPLDTVTTTVIQ